ncbi:helix-turn-helix DNA binding domain protein [Gordonia phage Soos]|nr:helix-turn-helix DNA binding domain protein [Gordonia phage Soos]
MSWEATSWALNHAEVEDALEHVILIAMADHADPYGNHVRPFQATLAKMARCSVRTVARKLAAMEERGVIVRGDQREVEHLPKGHRPVVWRLPIERRREPDNRPHDTVSPHDTGDIPPMTQPSHTPHDTAVSDRTSLELPRRGGGNDRVSRRSVPSPAPPPLPSSSPRCEAHRHLPDDAYIPPCRPCKLIRERYEAEKPPELTEGQRLAAIRRACNDCDEFGWPESGEDVRCTHPNVSSI